MAFVYVGFEAPVADATGNFTLAEPAGCQQGDLLVACIAYRGNVVIGLPSGWATVATQQSSGNTSTTTSTAIGSGLMAYIIRGSSAPDLTFTRTLGDVAFGSIVAYRSDQGRTISYDTGTANTLAANSTTVTTGTFTTAQYGELLLMACCGADDTSSSGYLAATGPASGIWLATPVDNYTTVTGADTFLTIVSAIKDVAGATGTLQYTAGNSSRHVCIVGAFKEATTGGLDHTAWAGPSQFSVTPGAGSAALPAITTPNSSLLAVMIGAVETSGTDNIEAALTITDDQGLTWTKQAGAGLAIGQSAAAQLWTAPVTTGAATIITIDCGAFSLDYLERSVHVFTGYNTGSPIGGTATHTDDNNAGVKTTTLSAAPAATSVVLAMVEGSEGFGVNIGAGTGWAKYFGATNVVRQGRYNSTSDVVTWDYWEATNGSIAAVAVEIKVAAAGGSAIAAIQHSYRRKRI